MEPPQNSPEKKDWYQRFSLQSRIQHMMLGGSVTALILTGIPLWCLARPEFMWWTQNSMQDQGFIEIVRIVHKIASVLMIVVCVYHLLYLAFSREGRREFIEFLPWPKDFVDVTHNCLYFLGIRKERPRFGRYTYYEKFDYWAVYWGCVIMIGSGMTLWYTDLSVKYLPWFTYDLAALVHADEAILATLAICVWHFYNVHYNPARFPGTLLWWHGKMSLEELKEDHPLEYEEVMRKQQNAEQEIDD